MKYLIPLAMGITLFLMMFLQGTSISTSLFGGVGALIGGGIVVFLLRKQK
ncbi:hypothetical protein BN988_02147 [Oceanobacillus picturae]|uniref:Uncharacterized protein n=1 Tax=Oceanobacillus picturae TaxID=171693 RepID=W9AD37_9BACI|nr:hypothetical protein [Oceanobacillus picturae]CDO03629.1 hypothetical protein BN988_02147 [Oceanobacillus picturae]